jgi:hypothetical protein
MKKLLPLTLIALIALPISVAGRNQWLDIYDTMRGPPFMKKMPPWIPGTEGKKEVKIQVLDATTMEPIEGAIVVGGYARGSADCVNSESAVSDAEGWVTLPNDQDPRVGGKGGLGLRGPHPESAYKRGYQLALPPRYAVSGGYNEWYIRERTPAPNGALHTEWEIISSRKFSDSHKAALMETKERSRIYLMPSTARTKEERAEELNVIRRGCGFTMPFEFSESEGMLAVRKAVYKELSEMGYYPDQKLGYGDEMLDSYEKSYRDFRRRNTKEQLQ